MMNDFKQYLGKLCKINPCCSEDRDSDSATNARARADPNKYKIIFTSGASEANCTVLQGIIDAYAEATGNLPHIVMSSIEHKSLLSMTQSYVERGRATATYVQPTPSGHIRPDDIERAITSTTAIVCVMHANNETGAINDIKGIGAVAHKANVPFHCDTVQSFGKTPINPVAENVDSMSISFHKFHGPPGIGALVIKQQLLLGYKMSPMIFGTQNEGIRGGTENLPGIGAAFVATKYTMDDRIGKNARTMRLKKYIMTEISARVPARPYSQYIKDQPGGTKPSVEIIFLSGPTEYYLGNTILLSVVKRKLPAICNIKIKSSLEAAGIVISVGSACNTASAKASHVLYSMGADDLIRAGALRISLGDDTTLEDAKRFIVEFLKVVKSQTE